MVEDLSLRDNVVGIVEFRYRDAVMPTQDGLFSRIDAAIGHIDEGHWGVDENDVENYWLNEEKFDKIRNIMFEDWMDDSDAMQVRGGVMDSIGGVILHLGLYDQMDD